ncbi:MAG: peptidase [Cellvibrionaceae bacterium]
MTYCVGIKVKSGLIFCSDSRTNAGIDQVNTYKKMYNFGIVGQSQYCILASGNLATTQGVINQIKKDIDTSASANLLSMHSMQDAAEYIGQISVAQQAKTGGGPMFQSNFLIGGQITGKDHELAMIYPEGNYITATERTPFLQIGESKYGKPILDRIINVDTDLQTCALCALVSMDSTLKSNLSVGPPIDIRFYHANSLNVGEYYHFDEDNHYLRQIHTTWNQKMIDSFLQLPPLSNVLEQQQASSN